MVVGSNHRIGGVEVTTKVQRKHVSKLDHSMCVIMDPRRCWGRPTLGESRLTIETLAGFRDAGDSSASIADGYERPVEQVELGIAIWDALLNWHASGDVVLTITAKKVTP